jgi:hypothetical protein
MVGYSCFYQFFIQFFTDANYATSEIKWGLFLKGGYELQNWQAAIVFWSTGVFIIGFPFLNDFLIKLTNKNYNQPLMWEKSS